MFVKQKQLFLIIFSSFLVGCASVQENLGIGELEWSSYSPEKQKKLVANYSKIVREKKDEIKYDEEKKLGDIYLAVNIHDGKVMFPPSFINWQSYKPVGFDIYKNQCRNVEIKSKSNDEVKTELGVCFKENILYLDPSRYDVSKKDGTATIHSSPLWTTGFSYEGINSGGYVKLNDVTVSVEKMEFLPKKTEK